MGYAKTLKEEEKVKVNKKKLYCLYGFFCKNIGLTDNGTSDCFNFLKDTIKDFKIKLEINFKKGRPVYIDRYQEHKDTNITPYL